MLLPKTSEFPYFRISVSFLVTGPYRKGFIYPLNTGPKLNVYKTFRRHPERPMHVPVTSSIQAVGDLRENIRKC